MFSQSEGPETGLGPGKSFSDFFLEMVCANMMMFILLQHGRQLLDSYRSLVDDLAQEDLDLLAHARSCSVSSIAGGGTGQPAGTPCSHSSSEPDQDQDQLPPALAVTPTYNHSFHGTVDGLPGRHYRNVTLCCTSPVHPD